jgi:hypothetical protein
MRRLTSSLITACALLAPAAALAQPAPETAKGERDAARDGSDTAREEGDATDDDGAADEGKGDYRVSAGGRRYRVRFDPGSRVTLSAGAAVMHDGEGNALAAFEAGFWFGYRKIYRSGAGEGRVSWQIDHQLTSGVVRPTVRPGGGDLPSIDATLYRATLLRHSESPSIVLPLAPPVTIGFPFDVGLDAELGRVTVPVLPVALPGLAPRGPWVHLGVVRTSFTLDPWRTGQPGRSLALGVGVRYDVDIYPSPTLGTPRFVHRVAPLTSGSVRFRYQTDDGLLSLDVFGEAAPHWTSEDTWALLANGSARLDRTLIAINDRPIGAYAEVSYRYLPEGAGAPALHDVRGTLGIAASLSLK